MLSNRNATILTIVMTMVLLLAAAWPCAALDAPTDLGVLPGFEKSMASAINASGQVVQFLSYEGAFTATGGAASGMTSVNIPVSESEATVKGNSLQLRGTGDTYAEFTWYANVKASAGVKNTSQTFATVIALMP